MYKWTWNTFRMQSGKSSSCHRVMPVYVSPENFENFHNTPEVIDDRKLMLDGEWPENRGCEYCKNLEEVTGLSDRTYHNDIPGLTPAEFQYSDIPLAVTPKISEIYINNTCDLACVYCRPEFSSKINEEVKKYGPYPIGLLPIEKTSRSKVYFDLYVDWVRQNYQKLDSISILGGEPFLQNEFWEILDNISQFEESDLKLQVTTNLNCKADTLKRFLDKSYNLLKNKKLKKIIISCSLDCWGPQIEFIRYGLNLQRWQQNFETLINVKWLHIEVHQVLTALSIKTSQDLQDRILEYKKINPKIVQGYHLPDSGYEKILHPMMFDSLFFSDKLSKLLDTFPITQEWDHSAKQRLEGIVNLCHRGVHNEQQLKIFKETLDLTDARRGTNWRHLYPEINDYLNNHKL